MIRLSKHESPARTDLAPGMRTTAGHRVLHQADSGLWYGFPEDPYEVQELWPVGYSHMPDLADPATAFLVGLQSSAFAEAKAAHAGRCTCSIRCGAGPCECEVAALEAMLAALGVEL